jgi:hypothetical protein
MSILSAVGNPRRSRESGSRQAEGGEEVNLCLLYGAYLHADDFARLRGFLKSYLMAFGVVCLGPYFLHPLLSEIGEMAGSNRFGNVIGLIPVFCALGAIVRTHVMGAEPDLTVSKVPAKE